jgi:hypothetical protein
MHHGLGHGQATHIISATHIVAKAVGTSVRTDCFGLLPLMDMLCTRRIGTRSGTLDLLGQYA